MILFSFDYPPLDGGISRLCEEITRQLRLHDTTVTVLSQRGVKNHFIDGPETIRVATKRPYREISSFVKLKRLKKKHSLIICGIWYPEGLIAIMAGCKNVVILGHGNELMAYDSGWRRTIWNVMRKIVLKKASYIIANSHFTADLIASIIPEARTQVLAPAVDHLHFKPGDREAARDAFGLDKAAFVIGTVSRIVRYKGHETVFSAIASLPQDQRRNVCYIIAGKGGDEAFLRSRAEALHVAESVRWIGFLEEAMLPVFYQALDMFALCTIEDKSAQSVEGFGLALLEAQACGVPVVGTRCGGIPEAVDEARGFLIDQGDHMAFAAILQTLLRDKSRAKNIGMDSRKRVEKECTWSMYVDNLTKYLQ